MTQIDPPQMEVRQLAPGQPDPSSRNPAAPVTIKNGKGEVLLDAVPDAQGRVTGNFPLDKNDGTLVIEQRLLSGDIQRDTVQTTPGRPVVLRQDPNTRMFTASEATSPPASVTVRNGAGKILEGAAPAGPGRLGAPISPADNDGTFVVEQVVDGRTYRYSASATPGTPVRLLMDSSTGIVFVPDPSLAVDPRAQIIPPLATGNAALGLGWTNRPDSKLFQKEVGGAPQGPGFTRSNDASSVGAEVGLSIPLAPDGWAAQSILGRPLQTRLNIEGGYGTSDYSDQQERIGANGQSFRLFSPGAGFATAQDLLNVRYANDYQEAFARVLLEKMYAVAQLGFMFTRVGLSYGWQTVDETVSFTTSTTSTQFTQTQKTDSTYFGVPLGGGMYWSLSDLLLEIDGRPATKDEIDGDRMKRALFAYVNGEFEPRFNSGETDWRVAVTGFSDRTSTLKSNDFNVAGRLEAGVMFGNPLGMGASPVSVKLGAYYRWQYYPYVDYTNPTVGNGGAELRYGFGSDVGVAVSGQIRF